MHDELESGLQFSGLLLAVLHHYSEHARLSLGYIHTCHAYLFPVDNRQLESGQQFVGLLLDVSVIVTLIPMAQFPVKEHSATIVSARWSLCKLILA